MEDKEKPTTPKIVKKSPQELASQAISVYSPDLTSSGHPEGAALDAKFRQRQQIIKDLLGQGANDDELSLALEKLYEESLGDSTYNPLAGDKADEFLQAAKQRMLSFGYSEDEAVKEAKADLAKRGFVGQLRQIRKSDERDIASKFDNFFGASQLSAQEEQEGIVKLRESCIYIDKANGGELADYFPGGNFLYHATNVGQAIQIIDSGELVNAKTLIEREQERAQSSGEEPQTIRRNSGVEGISWNFNEIGAMPGDRYHLTGFLTSPDTVLGSETQLAIPSRPAPNELILINENIDASRIYSLKTQYELLMDSSLGEQNSVFSNLTQAAYFKDNPSTYSGSLLVDYINSPATEEQMSEQLRGQYTKRDDGTIELAPSLLQRRDIPVGAVWLQGIIDTGRIKGIPSFENTATVREAIAILDKTNKKGLMDELKKEKQAIETALKPEEDKVTQIAVPIKDLFFVVPANDLDKWLKVIVRCGSRPKGIVVYDHKKVRLENFASDHRGDNSAMAEELRKVIPADQGYIDYEQQLLGQKITPDKITGHRKHVIGEAYLGNRKSMKKNQKGELVIA